MGLILKYQKLGHGCLLISQSKKLIFLANLKTGKEIEGRTGQVSQKPKLAQTTIPAKVRPKGGVPFFKSLLPLPSPSLPPFLHPFLPLSHRPHCDGFNLG